MTLSLQYRYKGRGAFLNAPYVGIIGGQWQLKDGAAGGSERWATLEDMVQASGSRSDAAARYRREIEGTIDR